MKRRNSYVRRSYKHSGTPSRADEEPTGQCRNDLAKAGLLFVLLGLFALIIPVLKIRHRSLAVPVLQPIHHTRPDDSDSHTIPPAVVEGTMGVGSRLVGVGLWVKR
jgi:hypothetical protein